MPCDTHPVPLTSWSRLVVVATVLAYRASMGEQPRAPVADRAAEAAFLAAGGDPALAARDVVLIVSAAARPPRLVLAPSPGADRAGGAVVEDARHLAAAEGPERVAGRTAGLMFSGPRPVNVRSAAKP